MRSLGVLQAVPQHARLDHAFDGLVPPRQVLEDDELASHPPTPRLVRRNSTFAGIFDDIPVSSYPVRPVVSDPMDPSQPQTGLSPELRSKSPLPLSRPSTPTFFNPFEVRARLLEQRQRTARL